MRTDRIGLIDFSIIFNLITPRLKMFLLLLEKYFLKDISRMYLLNVLSETLKERINSCYRLKEC